MLRIVALGGVVAAAVRGGLPGLCASPGRRRDRSSWRRAGRLAPPATCRADGAALSRPDYQGVGLAHDPPNAVDRSADPARRRHLPGSVRRHQSARRGPAGSLQAGLVVSHHVHRARRPHDVHVGVSRHQLPRRDLAERPPDRRQQPDRRHARRARTRRLADGSTSGGSNTLAVKVTPEQALQDINGVELADSWYDWINWNYLGYQGPGKNPANGNSFVADRNAGIWKPVYLRVSGAVVDRPVDGELRTSAAANGFRAADDLQQPAQCVGAAGARRAAGDDHPAGQARRPDRATGHARRGGAARGQLHPGRVRAADRAESRPVVALHARRSPTSTTCSWSSGSTTGRSTPAICGSASAPSSSTAIRTSSSPNSARAATSI